LNIWDSGAREHVFLRAKRPFLTYHWTLSNAEGGGQANEGRKRSPAKNKSERRGADHAASMFSANFGRKKDRKRVYGRGKYLDRRCARSGNCTRQIATLGPGYGRWEAASSSKYGGNRLVRQPGHRSPRGEPGRDEKWEHHTGRKLQENIRFKAEPAAGYAYVEQEAVGRQLRKQ